MVFHDKLVFGFQYSSIMFLTSWYDKAGFIVIISDASQATKGVAIDVHDFNQ